MARIERIKLRLNNWALWKARSMSSGLGFKTENVLYRLGKEADVWTRSTANGVAIPHLELEAEETDQAVQAMGDAHRHLYVTLDAIYLKDWGVTETARRIGKGPSTIHSHLDHIDRYIDAWLQEAQRQREEKEALARGRAYQSTGSLTP